MRKILLVLTLMLLLFNPASAKEGPPPVRPVRGSSTPMRELSLKQGETIVLETDFVLSIMDTERAFTVVEVSVGPPLFAIPDSPRTRELQENRVYYPDEGMYWTAHPDGVDYWYSGPMDGSQFHCKNYADGEYVCFENFLEEGEPE